MEDGTNRQGFRDLISWQKSIGLVVAIYEVTRGWPPEEQVGLTAQIRRAATSVPSNIAEARGRSGGKELLHHLSVAFGPMDDMGHLNVQVAYRKAAHEHPGGEDRDVKAAAPTRSRT